MTDKLTVVLDTTISVHSAGGVGKYVLRLADALRAHVCDSGIRFLTADVPSARPGTNAPAGKTDLTLPDPRYMHIPLFRRIPIALDSELNSRSARLLRLVGEKKGVYHHSGVQPVHPVGWDSVVTHFDPSAILHPEWHTDETVAFCRREEEMISSGSRVLAISDWAAAEAESCFSLPRGSAGVAHGAADPLYTPGKPDPAVLASFGLSPDGYVLHVGSFVPRKNIPFLTDVYGSCVKEGFDLQLVMVGAEEWHGAAPDESRQWLCRIDVPDDSDLLHLYRGARAVLLPSLYEGLGFPALEAMACHVPLVCSDSTALPGTVGGGGVLLDPVDREAWGRTIMSLADSDVVDSLRDMAAREPRRTWEAAARSASRFYRRVSV